MSKVKVPGDIHSPDKVFFVGVFVIFCPQKVDISLISVKMRVHIRNNTLRCF